MLSFPIILWRIFFFLSIHVVSLDGGGGIRQHASLSKNLKIVVCPSLHIFTDYDALSTQKPSSFAVFEIYRPIRMFIMSRPLLPLAKKQSAWPNKKIVIVSKIVLIVQLSYSNERKKREKKKTRQQAKPSQNNDDIQDDDDDDDDDDYKYIFLLFIDIVH